MTPNLVSAIFPTAVPLEVDDDGMYILPPIVPVKPLSEVRKRELGLADTSKENATQNQNVGGTPVSSCAITEDENSCSQGVVVVDDDLSSTDLNSDNETEMQEDKSRLEGQLDGKHPESNDANGLLGRRFDKSTHLEFTVRFQEGELGLLLRRRIPGSHGLRVLNVFDQGQARQDGRIRVGDFAVKLNGDDIHFFSTIRNCNGARDITFCRINGGETTKVVDNSGEDRTKSMEMSIHQDRNPGLIEKEQNNDGIDEQVFNEIQSPIIPKELRRDREHFANEKNEDDNVHAEDDPRIGCGQSIPGSKDAEQTSESPDYHTGMVEKRSLRQLRDEQARLMDLTSKGPARCSRPNVPIEQSTRLPPQILQFLNSARSDRFTYHHRRGVGHSLEICKMSTPGFKIALADRSGNSVVVTKSSVGYLQKLNHHQRRITKLRKIESRITKLRGSEKDSGAMTIQNNDVHEEDVADETNSSDDPGCRMKRFTLVFQPGKLGMGVLTTKSQYGFEVERIIENGQASKKAIKIGDFVCMVNGIGIKSVQDLEVSSGSKEITFVRVPKKNLGLTTAPGMRPSKRARVASPISTDIESHHD